MKQWTAETLFNTLKDVTLGGTICLYTPEICETLAPKINRIIELKHEKNAIILAHSYVVPEILRTISDFSGDSYELSQKAKQTNADTIVFAAVKFMAETAKLLNPTKRVLIPSTVNGCSLADSITGDDVSRLRAQYPDYTFVCYINTTVDVKAQCDVCVTSSNVYHIVSSLPNNNIYFLPDKLMAKNLINDLKEKGIQKNIKYWDGVCYVHEEYNPEMIDYIRTKHDKVDVVAHPECDESIVKRADFVGSTSQMINYVETHNSPAFFMLTECGLTSRLQLQDPSKTFVGSCTMCKYMKSNNLDNIIRVLESPNPEDEIHLDHTLAKNALASIDAMFKLSAS